MSKSAYKIRSFINRGPFRPAIASVVEHSGCKIVGIFPDPEPQGYYVETWGFHIQPNQTLRDLMSVNEPFLLIATEISDAQQREEEIRRELQQAYSTRDCKFCTDFAVLVTDSSLTEDAASEIARSSGVNLIHFSFEELQEAGAFLRRIRSRLFVRDLYWLTTAVRSARQFYGRHSLLDELETYLVQSKTHVGLFGLRKMGKTSLLYQLFDALRRRKGVLLCYLDMQRIDSISQTAEYFLWSLGEAIFSALARVRVPGLKLFGQYATFYDIADRQQVAALFDHDMQQVLDRVSHQLVIAFDEIELMSPSRRGSNWHSEFGRAWRMLRGVAQQSPGRISFLVAGTNPQVVETSRFHEEHDNPIYNYFRTVYLPPFSEADTGSLLRGVGHKLGLSWSQQGMPSRQLVY